MSSNRKEFTVLNSFPNNFWRLFIQGSPSPNRRSCPSLCAQAVSVCHRARFSARVSDSEAGVGLVMANWWWWLVPVERLRCFPFLSPCRFTAFLALILFCDSFFLSLVVIWECFISKRLTNCKKKLPEKFSDSKKYLQTIKKNLSNIRKRKAYHPTTERYAPRACRDRLLPNANC